MSGRNFQMQSVEKKKKKMAAKELRRKGRSRISVRTRSLEMGKITKCGSRAR